MSLLVSFILRAVCGKDDLCEKRSGKELEYKCNGVRIGQYFFFRRWVKRGVGSFGSRIFSATMIHRRPAIIWLVFTTRNDRDSTGEDWQAGYRDSECKSRVDEMTWFSDTYEKRLHLFLPPFFPDHKNVLVGKHYCAWVYLSKQRKICFVKNLFS